MLQDPLRYILTTVSISKHGSCHELVCRVLSCHGNEDSHKVRTMRFGGFSLPDGRADVRLRQSPHQHHSQRRVRLRAPLPSDLYPLHLGWLCRNQPLRQRPFGPSGVRQHSPRWPNRVRQHRVSSQRHSSCRQGEGGEWLSAGTAL